MRMPLSFSAYPPTSFPLRDLLVIHHLGAKRDDTVCEIGIGSGGTTARLAKHVGRVVGFEISEPTVRALRYLEARHPNLELVHADITKDDDTRSYEGAFTRAIACDTLEHVEDPAAFFRAVARLLAPGGEFLVTFPNESPERMHGVTRFDRPEDLEALVRGAGLELVTFGAASLSPWAERVAENLGWGPLRAVRSVLRRRRRATAETNGDDASPAAPPQRFEDTHFMRQMSGWKKLSPVVNLYWHGVLEAMELRGPSFVVDEGFRESSFRDCQVLVIGRKPG